ncbi:hypothetical protein [Pseudanabaena sp. FACHB-2040]|uniref:hypothetical protein n=1 Tax=Pseudanabaena sp. FACHB-2040 TaxID=2692859 RepID=UPI00168347BD|nr:hypothetical protein [Pseudanabaena sp. FACHB-2040]MBD2257524.1 hypothetical protein [Pseudanabaena sp. FACHB-2040]
MVWLAALLEILAFLEFLTSALGLSLMLWSGLYYGLSLGLQLDLMQAATLAGVVALIFYFRLE